MSEACARQNRDLRGYVKRSVKLEHLALRIVTVLERLPEEVLADFLGDPRFRLALDDYVPGHGRTVWMACPRPGADGSRCVLLKPRLAECQEDFAHYVIAHELAHAYPGARRALIQPPRSSSVISIVRPGPKAIATALPCGRDAMSSFKTNRIVGEDMLP